MFKRLHAEGIEAVPGHRPGRRPRLDASWIRLAVERVIRKTPRDFGFPRRRRCREAISVMMRQVHRTVEADERHVNAGGERHPASRAG